MNKLSLFALRTLGPGLYHKLRFPPTIVNFAIIHAQIPNHEKPVGTYEYVERLEKELENLDNDTKFAWKVQISNEMLNMHMHLMRHIHSLKNIINIVKYEEGNLRNLYRIGHHIGEGIKNNYDMTFENRNWNKISTYITYKDYKHIYYDIACNTDKENFEIKKSECLVYLYDKLNRTD